MTIEEKAKAYADNIRNHHQSYGKEVLTIDAVRNTVKEAYLAGAAETLRSQWRNAEKDPPPCGERIICATINVRNEIKELRVGERVGENSYRDWDDEYSFIGCNRWMYEPPLPNTEEQ